MVICEMFSKALPENTNLKKSVQKLQPFAAGVIVQFGPGASWSVSTVTMVTHQ